MEENDELLRLLRPLFDTLTSDQRKEMKQIVEMEAQGVLAWGVESGYFLWVSEHPGEIPTHAQVREWIHKAKDQRAYEGEKPIQITDKAPFAVSKNKPLIEQVLTRQRLNAAQYQGQFHLEYTAHATAIGIEQARKLFWTHSAAVMTEYLFPDSGEKQMINDYMSTKIAAASQSFPIEHCWIEFEQPEMSPVGMMSAMVLFPICRNSSMIETVKRTRSRVPSKFHEEIARPKSDMWTFKVWGEGIFPRNQYELSIAYQRERQITLLWEMRLFIQAGRAQWCIVPEHQCPWGECEETNKTTGMPINLCTRCRITMGYYAHWLNTAHLMLTGAFQERENTQWEEQTIETVRKVSRPDKPHKFHEIKVSHHYHVVSFDASVRKAKPAKDVQDRRGSWLEINPHSVVYVDRKIGETTRHLRHERFIHKRGQIVTVQGHEKRVPMRLSELRRKITKIEASQYSTQ